MIRALSPEAATYLGLTRLSDLPDGWDVSDLWLLLADRMAAVAEHPAALPIGGMATIKAAATELARLAAERRDAAGLLALPLPSERDGGTA